MKREDIVLKVNDLMRKGFEIPQEKLIPSATLFGDLGLDSLDAVDMLVYLEENLAIKIDGTRLMAVRTLEDVYSLAEELVVTQPHSQILAETEIEAPQF